MLDNRICIAQAAGPCQHAGCGVVVQLSRHQMGFDSRFGELQFLTHLQMQQEMIHAEFVLTSIQVCRKNQSVVCWSARELVKVMEMRTFLKIVTVVVMQ